MKHTYHQLQKKKKSIYVLYLTGNKPLMPNQYWNILVPTLYSPISSSSRNLKNYRCLFVIKNMQLFSVTPYNLIFLDDFTAMQVNNPFGKLVCLLLQFCSQQLEMEIDTGHRGSQPITVNDFGSLGYLEYRYIYLPNFYHRLLHLRKLENTLS